MTEAEIIRFSTADQATNEKNRKVFQNPQTGRAYVKSDLFDFFLISLAFSIARAARVNREYQTDECEFFEKERKEILKQFKVEAVCQIAETKNIRELAQISNVIGFTAEKISTLLPESERAAFVSQMHEISHNINDHAEIFEARE